MKKRQLRTNWKRKKELFERNFGAHAAVIRALRCCGCGKRPPSEAAHTVGRKMGGRGGDKRTLAPLCGNDPRDGWVGCHYLLDTDIEAFTERTGLTREDVRAIAVELWKQRGKEEDDGQEENTAPVL